MNKFKNLTIPEGITFRKRVTEDDVGDMNTSCSCITNGGLQIDYYDGVTGLHPGCRHISCCNCVFFKLNNKERLEYFKEVTKI